MGGGGGGGGGFSDRFPCRLLLDQQCEYQAHMCSVSLDFVRGTKIHQEGFFRFAHRHIVIESARAGWELETLQRV